ncbi:MAG: hypothetical protein NZ843_04110, partial [Fimbriimonadales bacterium]|nr:hypothetical protein [Fimbriimonadales bacterium]
ENIFSGISAQQFVRPYGMAAAASGFIYVADTPERFPGAIAEFCPGDPAVPGDAQVTQVVTIPATSEGYRAQTYGIVVDRDCVVWSADWNTQGRLIRWEPWLGAAGVAVSSQGLGGRTRGVNVDLNGYVWTSLSDLSGMARWNRNTLTIDAAYNDTCSPNHSGIGIAFGGQVVNPARPGGNSPTVTFINPQALVQTGCVNCPGINPYNYNDFTGAVLRFATNEGIWRAVYDGGCEDRIWGRLNWNAFIPQGTSVVVRVRAGNSQPILTEWQTVGNGQEFCIRGRYLEVEVRLSRTPRITRDCNYQRCAQNGEFITPIVYDIRATSLCACPPQSLRDVYGKVVCDSDGDGVASPADRPLQGWAVTIEDQQGNRLTRFTNEQGEYRFTDIPSGEYRLVQLTRPGWLPINPVNGEAEIEVNDSPVQLDFVNRLLGDVNGDGCVDDADLLAVLFAFGATGENLPEDITMDGVVDDADLLIVLFNFGADC